MKRLIQRRTLSIRHLALTGVLAISVLVSACAPKTAQPAAQRAAPAIPVSGAEVQRGEITQTLSYSGDIKATGQIAVLPKATGRVLQLHADLGSRVQAGQVLAELEYDSAAAQLFQARAGLAAAEAKLAQILAGGRAEDIAAAQASLVQQQVRLESMRTGRTDDVRLAEAALEAQLARLQFMEDGGRPEAIAQAEAAVEAARAKLDAVRRGATNDLIQAARSAVDSDLAALASAEAQLASIYSAQIADVQAAQSQIDSARAQVAAAEQALASLSTANAAELQAAQSALDAALAARSSARAAQQQASTPTPAQVLAAEAAVSQAEAALEQARANRTSLQQGAQPGACFKEQDGRRTNATACAAAQEAASDAVTASQRSLESARAQLRELRDGGAPASQAQSQATLDQAEANVRSARARLEAVQNGGTEAQRARAQSDLTAAQNTLRTAEARLASLQHGSLTAQQQAAEAAVVAAQERLRADEARLAELLAGPRDEDLQAARAAVEQAEQALLIAAMPATEQELRAQRAAVEQARLQVEKARNPYTSHDIQQQQQAIAAAQAQLQARTTPYTREDVLAAQAAVDQARAALELAELGIRETRVIAPVDGTVSERHAAPGALVSPTTPLFTLVPPSLELVVNVEEAHLGRIDVGQQVSLQVAAYPERTFEGTVTAIAPTLDPRSRTAAVRIVPSDEEQRLRSGMLAKLSITTAHRQNTLIVPRTSVLGQGAEAAVLVVGADQRVRRTPIRLGLTNEGFAEVLGGVREGEVIVTSGLTNLSDGDLVAARIDTQLAYAR